MQDVLECPQLHFAAAPIEAKKNEFNPYQDNGGYVFIYLRFVSCIELLWRSLEVILQLRLLMIVYPRDIRFALARVVRSLSCMFNK